MIAQDRDTNGRLRVPLTKRLRSALEKIGATSLGELHGLLNIRLQKLINCSDGTISELVSILNRAKAGEYDSLVTEGVSFGILDFGNLAERVFLEFSSRDQEIISLRWGGKTSGDQSLKKIAKTIGVSRERVRQIEKSWFQRLRIAGGKKLSSLLVRLASEGHQTPPVSVSAVSEAWIAACGKKLAFNISFYSRLLKKLSV